MDLTTLGFIIGAAAMWLPYLVFTYPDVMEWLYDWGVISVLITSFFSWLFVILILMLWGLLI